MQIRADIKIELKLDDVNSNSLGETINFLGIELGMAQKENSNTISNRHLKKIVCF